MPVSICSAGERHGLGAQLICHLKQPEWKYSQCVFFFKGESDDSILRLAKADGIVSK